GGFDLELLIVHSARGNRLFDLLLVDDVAARAPRPRLLDGLLGAALRANRRRFSKVIKTRAASNADALGAEFGLRHALASRPCSEGRAPCHPDRRLSNPSAAC